MRIVLAATLVAGAATLAGCSTGERMGADGVVEHQLYCGYALPWSVCDGKAQAICPTGYKTVSKTWDAMSGSQMFIRCNGDKPAPG